MRSHKPAIGFIFVTILLDALGIGLLIPVSPKLVELLTGGSVEGAAPVVGYLGATYAAMQFLFAPMLGSLSDRVGRRPVLLIALFGSAIDYFAGACVPTVGWLFITRAINGFSGASFSVAAAYIADITPPTKRAGAYGMMGAAFGLGFIIGPLLGGYLGHLSLRLPFFAAGGLTLANWLYGLVVLPESLPKDRRRAFSLARANPVGAFTHLRKYRIVLGIAVATLLLNTAQFALHSVWVLYTSYQYGWDEMHVGFSLACVGVGAAAVQGFLARKLVPKLGEKRAMIIGVSIGVLAYIGYGSVPPGYGWMIYVIVCFASLGAIGQPAAQSLITRVVKPTEQGETQGALSSLQSFANILGPLIGSSVFAYFISDKVPFKIPGAPFYVSATLALLGLGVIAFTLSRHKFEAAVDHPHEPGERLPSDLAVEEQASTGAAP